VLGLQTDSELKKGGRANREEPGSRCGQEEAAADGLSIIHGDSSTYRVRNQAPDVVAFLMRSYKVERLKWFGSELVTLAAYRIRRGKEC
jgi:hypothetical protein